MSIPTSGIPSLSNADPDPAAARPPLFLPARPADPITLRSSRRSSIDCVRRRPWEKLPRASCQRTNDSSAAPLSVRSQPQRATTQIVRVDEPDFLSSVTA